MVGVHLRSYHSPLLWPLLYSLQSSSKAVIFTTLYGVTLSPCFTYGEIEAQRMTSVAQNHTVSDGVSVQGWGGGMELWDHLALCPHFTDEKGKAQRRGGQELTIRGPPPLDTYCSPRHRTGEPQILWGSRTMHSLPQEPCQLPDEAQPEIPSFTSSDSKHGGARWWPSSQAPESARPRVPMLTVLCCVSLGKRPHLSEPYFPHCGVSLQITAEWFT